MSNTPQVTVLIPVYNRAQYVGAAIDSILAQQFTNFELLLIDDGSTDESLEILQSYAIDPRVRILCNERNLGIPGTRNKGVALARGEYVAMLDSDDYAYPTRLGRQVEFLDRHPDYALVGTWTAGMNDRGQPLRKLRLLPVSPEEVRARLLFQCCPAQSSIMARTQLLQQYGYHEDYSVSSDYDLWVRLSQRYQLGNLPTVLVRSRMHKNRITREKSDLVQAKCVTIIGSQLTALGVMFTPADAERHFLLLRMTKRQFVPDQDYVEWADDWLQKLQTANQQTHCYAQEVLARQLGQIWFLVCWQAVSTLGWSIWKRFWQSPLSVAVWMSLRQYRFLLRPNNDQYESKT